MTVSNETRTRVKTAFEPLALALGRLGFTPSALTLLGFGITVAGAALLAAGIWLAGGIVVFIGGAFDLFDGTLARATGRASRLGAFMDSVFDRWGEGIVYVGIAWGCVAGGFGEGAVLSALAMASAFMVSYARAKSENQGFTPGTGMAAIGLAPREVRIVILAAGLVLVGLTGGADGPALANNLVMAGTLGLIALLATITTIQRIVHVIGQSQREHE